MNKYLALVLLYVIAMPALAQRPSTDSIGGKVHHIDNVEVTSHRLSANVIAGKPIQTMEKSEIELLGLQNLSDAVKKFAGTNVRDYGGIGGMKTVSVRNLGAHHTAVSYDGVTISNTQAGQIDIGQLSLDNVESIGMAIGDDNDMMQTARHYASAGVLFINTERPHFDNKDWGLRFRMKGGSFGLASPMLRYWQKIDDSTAVAIDGTYMRADGTYPFTLVNNTVKTKEKRYNSDIYSWQGEANIYHSFIDGGKLNVKSYYYYSQRGLPGAVILYNNTSNERLWDENFFMQASYSKSMSRQWKLKAHLKYTHTWNKYEDYEPKYEGGKQSDIDRQNECYASATVGWLPTEHLSLSWAQDVSFNVLHNNINDSPNPKRVTLLSALSARYDLQRLLIQANLVGTYATEQVRTGNGPADRKRLSPSLSVSYRLFDSQALYVRAMMKNTFRIPTFNDLYYLRIGNTGLRPEKANEYNVGLTWSGRPFKGISYLTATVDAYYNNVKDKIVAFPSTYIWKMANFGKVYIHGIDFTLATEVPIIDKVSVVLTGAYSLQKAVDKTDKSSQSYGDQLPYTPENSGNISVLIHNPWVNIGYSMLICGKRYSMAQNLKQYEIKSYTEHTLTLQHEFRMKSLTMTLSGSVQNLFDKQYEIIKYYPMPGRNYLITGTINI
jgi:vitamin B12 transporter